MKIINILEEILKNHCDREIKLENNMHLISDVGLDSLALLTLIVEVENKFQIVLNEDPLSPPETVGQVIQLIEKSLKQQAPKGPALDLSPQ